jgi:hypothetical protein
MARQVNDPRRYVEEDYGDLINMLGDEGLNSIQRDTRNRNVGRRATNLKLIDGYDTTEGDNLMDLIVRRKRDIRRIPETETPLGAQRYIDKRGLGEHLAVFDDDIDGDGVPDTIIRQRGTGLPYIVKGYKTEKSKYPLRRYYRQVYPDKTARKEHPMKEYLSETLGTTYDSPTTRYYTNQDAVNELRALEAKGYAKMVPKSRISVAQAFKVHVMKPIMTSLKRILKESNIELRLPPQNAREMEAAIRDKILVFPILRAINPELLDPEITSLDDFKKAKNTAEVRNAAFDVLQMYLQNEHQHEFMLQVTESIIDKLERERSIPELDQALKDEIIRSTALYLPRRGSGQPRQPPRPPIVLGEDEIAP